MAAKRTVFILLAVWEICRILFLITLFSRLFSGTPFPGGDAMAILMLIGSGNLVVPAGAVYLFFAKKESTPAILVLAFGKLAGLVSAALGIVAVIGRFAAAAKGGLTPTGAGGLFLEGVSLFVIVALDLIFLALLLSFKVEADRD